MNNSTARPHCLPFRNWSTKSKWYFGIALAIGLIGALFGGICGGLIAAFAGDSWWTNKFALGCFQYAVVAGGVCLGATPGAVWLLCLKQRWVIPFLFVAGSALLLPLFEWMQISNTTLGLSYAGALVFGFLVGLLLWVKRGVPANP